MPASIAGCGPELRQIDSQAFDVHEARAYRARAADGMPTKKGRPKGGL
jgi:hypothetical protein